MRLTITTLTITLLASSLASSASAQQYLGARPYYGPAQPAGMYQPQAEPPLPENGAQELADPMEPMESAEPLGQSALATGCTTASNAACEACDLCRVAWRPRGLFVMGEYNMWWTKTRSVPPLVTTSPVGTPLLNTGVLPDAQILYGNNKVGGDIGNGGRLTVGQWLGDNETVAIVGRYTGFDAASGDFSASSAQYPNLAIPYYDAQLGIENAYQFAYTPNGSTIFANGDVNVRDRVDITGVDVYGQFLLYQEYGTRFDFIGGYQMLTLDSGLSIDSTLVSQNIAIGTPVGTSIFIQDNFNTGNEFHGGQIGLSTTVDWGCWNFNMLGKIGVGNMHQSISIDGATVITPPAGAIDVRNEGLFVQNSNRGFYTNDRVAYIPEVGLKLGYRIRPNLNLSLGYSFIYISNVVLGGDQVDRQLNLSQSNGGPATGPNQNRPEFLGFRETDFWAQGLNFGVEYKF
jgi:hypothetical protein